MVPELAATPVAGTVLRPLATPPARSTLYAALRGGPAAGPPYRTVLDVLRERAVTVASQLRAAALR